MAANGEAGRGRGRLRARRREEDRGKAGREPADGPQATCSLDSIDWAAMKARVRERLRAGRQYKTRLTTRIRDGLSIDDVVQEAITEQFAAWEAGEAVPDDLAIVEAALVVRANRRWKAWMKRARERERLAGFVEIDAALSTRDMFEVICARDECAKFFVALGDSLDTEAQKLLEKLLAQGIAFEDTKGLAEPPAITEPHVHNMKRRIITHSRRIMANLIAAGKPGDAS